MILGTVTELRLRKAYDRYSQSREYKMVWTMELDRTEPSHQPRSSPPNETPKIEHPRPRVIHPPERIK